MTEGGRHARSAGMDDDATGQAELLGGGQDDAWPFDPELLRLVQFVNAVDSAEVGVTLHVHGCVVSGMLVSVARYYRMLVDEFTDLKPEAHASSEVAGSFVKLYRQALEKVERELSEGRARQKMPALPRHLHLRQAQTIVSGQGPVTTSLWRGRLTEVDGWAFGSLGPAPSHRGFAL